MAKMNGVNSDMVKGPVGEKSTRVNPATISRNGLAKNGVNQHLGGTTAKGKKPTKSKGKVDEGKGSNY